jgi:hypothetical protein
MYKVVLVQNLAKSDYLHIHMAHSDINDPGVLNAQGPPLLSSCSGYSCIDLYVAMVRGQDHVPSTMSARQDKMRATMMFEHYDCMITQDEKNLFMNKNADKGSVVILKEHLDFVVLASLIWAFAAQKVCVYKALGDRYLLVFLQACKFVLPCHCLSLSPSPSLPLSLPFSPSLSLGSFHWFHVSPPCCTVVRKEEEPCWPTKKMRRALLANKKTVGVTRPGSQGWMSFGW